MSLLYIDGVSSRDLTLGVVAKGRVVKYRTVPEGTRTEHFLKRVAQATGNMRGLTGIAVAQGSGSFSQGRIACAITNALAYARGLKVAVVGVTALTHLPAALSKVRWGRLALPRYRAPAVQPFVKPARKGFTLIELLVVIAIIGILATIVSAAVNQARQKGWNARVRGDLKQLRTAILLLEDDTGKWPNGCTPNAGANPEVALDQPRAGLRERPTVGTVDTCTWTQAEVDRWKGPYVSQVTDPWGTAYDFDPDYTPYSQVACATPDEPETVVVVSYGPNKAGRNVYDCDDVFLKIE